jgi:aminoglycoside phosphotransferase (APT) family kinase protein
MNFIEHPSYLEQIHDIDLILSKLTMENMNKLLERFRLKCISFERLQTSGQINLIFNLKAQSNTLSSIEFILKISNPHRYWKEYRTKNEVYTMQYLIEHTTIPIPKIIDYSNDAKTSILSCEYILMEKIQGNTLESVIENMPNQTLVITAMELTDYVKQLRQINFPQMNRIGSFSNKQMFLGGSIEDGPTLGPFNTLKEYIIEHLQWAIKRIQTDEQLFQHGKHLIDSLEKIIHDAETDLNLLNPKIKFHITHTDLNSSNILIDENTGKILAILDWERCAITFTNNDIEFYSHWFDDKQQEKQFQSIIEQQQNYLDLVHDASNMQYIKWYLDIMYPAMYATFYSCTWFECEQTVTEHMKRFLQETEEAIIAFNNNKLQDRIEGD